MHRAALLILMLVTAGCDEEVPAPHPEDYDSTCETAADCAVVYFNDSCPQSCTATTVHALSTTGASSYEADRSAWSAVESCDTILDIACVTPSKQEYTDALECNTDSTCVIGELD